MLGIIGGTGLYQIEGLEVIREHEANTPFGAPSAAIIQGKLAGREVFFLPRHGIGHRLLPHEVNYRANIWALKSLGVTKLISISAVGSLSEDIKPGELAIPSQYFDHTRGKRAYSFFGDGIVGHISTAKPSCAALSGDILKAAKEIELKIHTDKIYACVEGPRLGTQAESFFLRAAKCDLVGMTNIPEAFLAREAQMAYSTIAIATDYDCWHDDPADFVTLEKVFEIYGQSVGKVKQLLTEVAKGELTPTPDEIRKGLEHAIITKDDALNDNQRAMLAVLRA